jgi:uncharacterized repeat protein (TIGR01451 family)
MNPAHPCASRLSNPRGLAGAVCGLLLLGPAAARPEPARDRAVRSYLRQDGGRWVEVRRDARGRIVSPPRPAAAPADRRLQSNAFGTLSAFAPYVSVPTGSWPEAVAIGDLNGDGRNDVALVTSYYYDPDNDHKLFVFLQTPEGTLAAPTKYPVGASGARSVALGDVNGDGRLDVVVGNGDSIGILLQNALGTLDAMATMATPDSYAVETGDFNDDGRTDVVGLAVGTADVAVFLQNASGSLDPPETYPAPHSVAVVEVGDVNADGRDDIVVTNQQGFTSSLVVLLQKPGGGFEAPASQVVSGSEFTHGAGSGDVDGDGRRDVVVTGGSNGPSAFLAVFRQNAGGTLEPPAILAAYDSPQPAVVADINGDGREDVVVLHGGWLRLGAFLQNADGSLAPEALTPVPYASYGPQGLAIGDINGDGLPDAVIADYGGSLDVLYHRTGHDVGVSITGSPDPVTMGSNVTYTADVRNEGSEPMTVTLADTLPAGTAYVSSSPAGLCSASGRVVTCGLGSLAGGEETLVTIVASVEVVGTIVDRASVSTAETDGNPANDSASVSTQAVLPSCSERVASGDLENPAAWSQYSTHFGTVICTLAQCGNGGGTAGPRGGAHWAWFGGVPALEQGALAQAVTIPKGRTQLVFHLWIGAASGNGADYLTAFVDSTPVFTAIENDARFRGGYQEVAVDVSAFADGASHVIGFASTTYGKVTNFNLDDVSLTSCPHPVLSLGSAAVDEGDSGTVTATLTLSLAAPYALPVGVSFTTVDGSATAGSDFLPASGTLTIPPGATSATLGIAVLGDRVFEPDENLAVELSAPVNAVIQAGGGGITIRNDDAAGLALSDVAVIEPAQGTKSAVFTVALSPPSAGVVTVDWATADGTALAGSDYEASSGTLTFPPGSTAQSFEVTVLADGETEAPETFAVQLSGAGGAPVAFGQATATIAEAGFYSVSPCRVLDTRGPAGPLAGPALAAGGDRTFPVAGQCGVPAWARAASVNVTVTQPAKSGHVRLYPGGSAPPATSALNYLAGQTRANNAIAVLGPGGDLGVACRQASGTAHLIVDVNGYFAEE